METITRKQVKEALDIVEKDLFRRYNDISDKHEDIAKFNNYSDFIAYWRIQPGTHKIYHIMFDVCCVNLFDNFGDFETKLRKMMNEAESLEDQQTYNRFILDIVNERIPLNFSISADQINNDITKNETNGDFI